MNNMNIDIRKSEIGCFEVVRLEPVVVGTFDQESHARLFLDALAGKPRTTGPAERGGEPLVGKVIPAIVALAKTTPVKPLAEPPAPKAQAADPTPIAKTTRLPPAAVSETPVAKPAKQPVKPATENLPALLGGDIEPEDWVVALNRIAGGEKFTAVAEAMGLPFGKLRSKWALAVQSGTHQKPGADNPVSGGVTGVLERGKGSTWTSEQDDAILAARPEYLSELAKLYGLSAEIVRNRQLALETKLSKMMQED